MKKKSEFEAPYIGIETIDNTPIFYNRRGDYSVIIKCENPIIQYSADMDAYYDFHHLFTNILKVLGTGYTIQKQDILCKKSFLPPQNRKNDYLSNRYFEPFFKLKFSFLFQDLFATSKIPLSFLAILTLSRKVSIIGIFRSIPYIYKIGSEASPDITFTVLLPNTNCKKFCFSE